MEQPTIAFGRGWHGEERDELLAFRWMEGEGTLLVPSGTMAAFKYMRLPVFSEYVDNSQILTVSLAGRRLAEWPLIHKWNTYSLDLGATAGGFSDSSRVELCLGLNKLLPPKYHPDDSRRLGVRVAAPEFHNDDEVHAGFLFVHRIALRNHVELVAGKTVLESFPLNLGIDLYGKCNINPPCVYCLWDRMKVLEGEYTDAVVDRAALDGYGPFFKSARTLVNCSFGEPLLHPGLEEILEHVARHGKVLELSTNGQAFTDRTIRALAGKPVYLYISLDAATAETYAKVRNDRWAPIVPNLLKLNEARQKAGNHLPKLFMVFMPMKVNRGDLEAYFRLCRDIEADFLVLRPLLHLWKPRIEADRGGYHFDYANEMLSREEAEEIIARSGELSRTYGIRVANQYNFGLTPNREDGDSSEEKDDR
ncbi:MAG: radical SAM protein [Candidatus Aminicenantales bacterium]